MPIYEFVCMECETHYEELVGMNAGDPPCPDCGASKVARQLSVFAALAAQGTAGQSAPAPRATGGGGCCGGACGC